MKQHSLHHSIYICEVTLKILMETHELLGRLPVWRNKLHVCGPCFLLCCACFFPFFQLLSMTVHQYDKWLCKTVQICVGWSIRTKQSINSKLHLMPRKSEFLLWKIPGALIQFVEWNWSYAMETKNVNMLPNSSRR